MNQVRNQQIFHGILFDQTSFTDVFFLWTISNNGP